MILTTSQAIENRSVTDYLGIVSGETIIGANFLRDFFASIKDFFGGRSGSYEDVFQKARETSMNQIKEKASHLNADAIIAIEFHYQTIGKGSSMLMVGINGTAVRISQPSDKVLCHLNQ